MKLVRSSLALSCLVLAACSSPGTDLMRAPASVGGVSPAEFPAIVADNGSMDQLVARAIEKTSKNLPAAEKKRVAERLKTYLLFLGVKSQELQSAMSASTLQTEAAAVADGGEGGGGVIKALDRLFQGSTQFLFCDDLTDWACLEKRPSLNPSAKFRIESSDALGKPVKAGSRLDMDYFFTTAWDKVRPEAGVAEEFAKRIERDGTKSLAIAMYGIDDIEQSMKPVYDAIQKVAKKATFPLQVVVDVEGVEKAPKPWIHSYSKPKTNVERWVFGEHATPSTTGLKFEYDGTPSAIRSLNSAVKLHDKARVRIEYPFAGIMHNKYAVMTNVKGEKAVWTGTANISKTCMGIEKNANMSIYIRNDAIAQSFQDQFDMMFKHDASLGLKSKNLIPETGSTLVTGRFHRNKIPSSRRYFKFDDGMEVRVHFAPTDDGEHRAILPMLYSARPGDVIRIAMFGGTGYELVRGFQFAAAMGATVQIVFDKSLVFSATSWAKDPALNVFMKNPYLEAAKKFRGNAPAGSIELRTNGWAGLNHHKVATLTRAKGNAYVADTLIVGSQNWSTSGNDDNDENMLSFQHKGENIDAAVQFNREFDDHLWRLSKEVTPK